MSRPIYETIGRQYSQRRTPDPRITKQIAAALGKATTVCNVGAGTGAYEPTDRNVVAVEPSLTMIRQRRSFSHVVKATAEKIPFADQQFDASLASLTIHHWSNPRRGLAEMQRISERQVIFTFDPDMQDRLWLVRDYLPEIMELESSRTLTIDQIVEVLQPARVEVIPVPWDCTDGFQAAYWRRPVEYLSAEARACISTLALLPQDIVSRAVDRLSKDLDSGEWMQRYGDLMSLDEMDFGYRLIVSE